MIALLLVAFATPNPAHTPGLARPLTRDQVCGTRWGRDRRHVTPAMRRQVFTAYGIAWRLHRSYEVDHLIPRELGGADDIANLWPQPWEDAHRKDHEENRLHQAVCAGAIALDAAQDRMRRWGR